MKVDLKRIEDEIALGNVNFQVHPSLPLRILKYSKQAVYTQAWNDITMRCRGLVIDDAGNIVVNCMPKFYNNNQAEVAAVLKRTENLVYEVFDKMDGSLLQIAKWNGHTVITSSGSFDSPQVHKATEMLLNKYSHYVFKDGLTYIFEIIYKENRIVLDYGDRESLTLLAVRETDTGEDIHVGLGIGGYSDWDLVQSVNKTIPEILAELPLDKFINKEGFVVKFANGDRVKYKYDKYVILHKAISGISSKWVHACLRDGLDTNNVLVDVPDELLGWVDAEKAKFKEAFDESMKHALSVYEEVKQKAQTRKEQAALVLSQHKMVAKLVFGLLDGRDISKMIWDTIEPSGEQSKKWGIGACLEEE